MIKIILNPNYVDSGDIKETGKYLYVENGVETPVTVWLEKSKANDKHPDGKPWIKLPKDNGANRTYFSEDLFKAENVEGEIEVEVKTSGPRILGASGVNKNVVKYLDEADAELYTNIVENALAAYKEAKATVKAKKPEEMSVEELEAYIEALKSGVKAAGKVGPKSFIDCISDEDYAIYNDLIQKSVENKANAPKAKKGPLTEEQKAARAEKVKTTKISAAEKLLAAMRANAE